MSHQIFLISTIDGERYITRRGNFPTRDEAVESAMATHFEFSDRRIQHAVRVVDKHNEQVFVITAGYCSCHLRKA